MKEEVEEFYLQIQNKLLIVEIVYMYIEII